MGDLENNNQQRYDNDLRNLMGSLQGAINYHRDSDDKDIVKLRGLLEEAYKIIEKQKLEIAKLNDNKLPTKDEVESISAMLDLVNKLDPETINKLKIFGGRK